MDIDLLSQMVKELILDNDRVALPGIGTFVAELVPASFSDKGFTINPPYRRLSFRPKAGDDDLLVSLYVESNNVEKPVAERIVTDFLAEMRAVLQEKKVVIFPGLGRLRATRENNFFFVADEDLDIYPEGFGLAPVSLKTHQESKEELSAAVEELRSIIDEPVAKPGAVEAEPEVIAVAEPIAVAEEEGTEVAEAERIEAAKETEEAAETAETESIAVAEADETAEAEPEAITEAEAMMVAEATTEAEPEAITDVEAEAAEEAESEARTGAEPEATTEAGVEPEAMMVAEATMVAGVEPEAEPEATSEVEATMEAEPTAEAVQVAEPEAGAKPKRGRWALWTIVGIAVAAVLLFGVYLLLVKVAPEFIDKLLYSAEELEIIRDSANIEL